MASIEEVRQGLKDARERRKYVVDALETFRNGPRGKRLYFLYHKELEDKGLNEAEQNEKNMLAYREDRLEEAAMEVEAWGAKLREMTSAATAVQTGNKHKQEASEEETEHKRYMKRLARLPCPSDLARTWQQPSSCDPMFLNHRPLSSSGIPTELLHPIFDFLKIGHIN
ncbi:3283_t:CDS:1 [Paraglomus brasilianum]|uniref:3283_t:CDS:1 n=1 Tax=Paraglomus brasilianum TaxID=144538 RepID=A0A9N9DWS2_9GLOM|nr:3283_t:CDS:1 [Paraglomus brasilianum]